MSDATKPPDWFSNFNHAIQQKLSAYMPMADIQVVVEEARKLFAAESAPLRERAERAEFDRDNYKAAWAEVDRGLKENREVLSTALADAAALRERVEASASNHLRQTADWAKSLREERHRADTAEALALTNGEARGRAEAKLAKLRADMEDMVTEAARATELDAKLERLADGLTENGRAIAAAEALALTNGAERDELRGLLAEPAQIDVSGLCVLCGGYPEECAEDAACFGGKAREWLSAHPAIPEGPPPGERGTP